MNKLHNNPFHSFLFTGVLLALVWMSRVDINAKAQNQQNKTSANETAILSKQEPALKPIPLTISHFTSPVSPTNTQQNNQQLESYPVKINESAKLDLSAKIVLAKDLESETVLFSKNSDNYWPIASVSKLMTAIVALEKIGPDKIIAISQNAISTEGVAGNFLVDEEYSVKDLVKIMLFVSSNDAAAALSEFYGRQNFLNEMNLKAKEVGMHQTGFSDETGLSPSNQSTTEDLTKLAKYILNNKPEIFEFTQPKEMSAVERRNNTVKFFTNINAFSGQKDFLGGKTGYTETAEENLLSVFEYQNRKILTIVLGSSNRFQDTSDLFNWIKSSYNF